MAACIAVTSFFGFAASGAGSPSVPPAPEHLVQALERGARHVHVDCSDARRGLRFYRARYVTWRAKMGAAAGRFDSAKRCPRIRYQAKAWRLRSAQARQSFGRWWQYAWWAWMPDKWQRVGACETGYGRRPGQFSWNSGTFQGFVGFYYGTWDAYKPSGYPAEAYQATPRQQMTVAEIVRAAHGYGAWGCGGA